MCKENPMSLWGPLCHLSTQISHAMLLGLHCLSLHRRGGCCSAGGCRLSASKRTENCLAAAVGAISVVNWDDFSEHLKYLKSPRKDCFHCDGRFAGVFFGSPTDGREPLGKPRRSCTDGRNIQ